MGEKKVRIPLRLNETLRLAYKKGESSIALEAVRMSAPYSRSRHRALSMAFRLIASVHDARAVHCFTTPGSRLEHRTVVRWVKLAKKEAELTEVLNIARGLAKSGRLERSILRKLRTFGYHDWWEPIQDAWRNFRHWFLGPASQRGFS